MAFGLSSKNRISPIAVDFGSDTLKVLQIDAGERTEMVAAGSALLPEEARGDHATAADLPRGVAEVAAPLAAVPAAAGRCSRSRASRR